MKPTPLERTILKTITYFDLQEYPLTAFEVWKWLYKPECSGEECSLDAVEQLLEHSPWLKIHISRSEGFYHLVGRGRIVHERKRRNNRVDEQMRKVQKMVTWLRLFSPIRMIAIASSLSTGNVKETSDIDLFIIARRGQVWIARFLAAGFLKLLRQRPEPKTTKDRFCLTYFITADALDISSGQVDSDDIVYHYYVQSFLPIYDPDNVYQEYNKANEWLKKNLPNGHAPQYHVHMVHASRVLRIWHKIFDILMWPLVGGPWGEWCRVVQLKILPRSLKSIANIDSRVIISDSMLKFHDKDNRKELRKLWLDSCTQHEAESNTI